MAILSPSKRRALRLLTIGAFVIVTTSHLEASEDADAKIWQQHRDAARVARDQNNYELADVEYKLALAEAEKFGRDDIHLPDTLSEISRFYVGRREFAKAEPLVKRAAAIEATNVSLNNAYVYFLMVQLAEVYTYEKKYGDAEKTLLNTKDSAEHVLGKFNPVLAYVLKGFGQLEYARGHYKEAAKYAKDGLSIADNVLISARASRGSARLQHQSLLASLYNLSGLIAAAEEKNKDAEKFFRKEVKLLESEFGTDDANLFAPLFDLTRLHIKKGDRKSASEGLERLEQIAKKKTPPTHPVWKDLKQLRAEIDKLDSNSRH